jgi:SAM-dependent methyltransferase
MILRTIPPVEAEDQAERHGAALLASTSPAAPEAWLAGRECALCGSRGVPYGEKDGYSLRECGCRGAVLLSWPWESVAAYERWYRDEAATYHRGFQEAQGMPQFLDRDGEYLQAASVRLRVLSGLYPGARTALDIGAGTGAFVALLAAHGWQAAGYEPSPVLAEVAQRRGRDVRTGGWEEVPLPETPRDLITLHDVLEHLPDPLRCLARLRSFLGEHGILCVEMPEWGCPEAKREGVRFRHVKPREHLALYSEAAAVALFHQIGLAVDALVRPLAGSLGKIVFYLRRV